VAAALSNECPIFWRIGRVVGRAKTTVTEMDLELIDKVTRAIRTRHMLQYTLTAKDEVRIVEPHAFGIGLDGRDLLWSWRVSAMGNAASRQEAWELCRLDEMRDVQLLDETFQGLRPGYKRRNPQMPKVHSQL
jgi:hypothetical protein